MRDRVWFRSAVLAVPFLGFAICAVFFSIDGRESTERMAIAEEAPLTREWKGHLRYSFSASKDAEKALEEGKKWLKETDIANTAMEFELQDAGGHGDWEYYESNKVVTTYNLSGTLDGGKKERSLLEQMVQKWDEGRSVSYNADSDMLIHERVVLIINRSHNFYILHVFSKPLKYSYEWKRCTEYGEETGKEENAGYQGIWFHWAGKLSPGGREISGSNLWHGPDLAETVEKAKKWARASKSTYNAEQKLVSLGSADLAIQDEQIPPVFIGRSILHDEAELSNFRQQWDHHDENATLSVEWTLEKD